MTTLKQNTSNLDTRCEQSVMQICGNLRKSQDFNNYFKVFRNLLINLTNKLFDVMNIWGKARNFNFERNFLQRHCLKSFALKNFCHRFAIFPLLGKILSYLGVSSIFSFRYTCRLERPYCVMNKIKIIHSRLTNKMLGIYWK